MSTALSLSLEAAVEMVKYFLELLELLFDGRIVEWKLGYVRLYQFLLHGLQLWALCPHTVAN